MGLRTGPDSAVSDRIPPMRPAACAVGEIPKPPPPAVEVRVARWRNLRPLKARACSRRVGGAPGTRRVLSESTFPLWALKTSSGGGLGTPSQGLVPQAVASTEPCPSKLSTCPQEIKRACPLHPTKLMCPFHSQTDKHPAIQGR